MALCSIQITRVIKAVKLNSIPKYHYASFGKNYNDRSGLKELPQKLMRKKAWLISKADL